MDEPTPGGAPDPTPDPAAGLAPGQAEPTPTPTSGGLGGGGDADARKFQSLYDQSRAREEALQKRLAELEGAAKTTEPTPSPLTREDIERSVFDTVTRASGLAVARDQLREKYPLVAKVHEDLFKDISQFRSVDDLTARVVALDEVLQGAIAQGSADQNAALVAEYEKRFGKLQAAPADSGGAAVGQLTVEAIGAMSFAEMGEYEKAHPGEMQRVLEAAGA